MKIMVAGAALLSGHKEARSKLSSSPKSPTATDNARDTAGEKSIDRNDAAPNAATRRNKAENSSKEKASPGYSEAGEAAPALKRSLIDDRRSVEQTTPPVASPISPLQFAIGSDDSSSPAVSSISSQMTSTENGQRHPGWQTHPRQHPSMIAPMVERLLPVGNATARTSGQGSAQRNPRYEDPRVSPESPLSKMDILTVNSSFDQDSETCASSDVTSPRSISQLEFPMPERLLPVGPQRESNVYGLAERAQKAPLGLPQMEESSVRSAADNRGGGKEKEMFDSQKRDSVTSEIASQLNLLPCNEQRSSRSASPRRLIKQVALESPPPVIESDDIYFRLSEYEKKLKFKDHARVQRDGKARRLVTGTGHHVITHTKRMDSWTGPKTQPNLDPMAQQACHADFSLKQSLFRVGDDCAYERCCECGSIKEEYSDEELGLCIITLGTFIHREPSLAAPLLPEILTIVTKVALNAMYPWQNETNMHLPGGAVSVAHQFVRCVLHQLAPNGIFVQMFQTHINEKTRMQFFKSVAQALLDFNELNPIAPLQLLLETLNGKKTLPIDSLPIILYNIACYLDCLPLEAGLGPGATTWSGLLAQFDGLFRRIVLLLPSLNDVAPLLRIMISILKVQGIQQSKGILDPFSKILSYAIQHSTIKYSYLIDLCYLCNRSFPRDRDKHVLARTIVFELGQAMKFKTTIPDNNFLLLLHFVLQDVGGILPATIAVEKIPTEISPIYNTNASESLKTQLPDVLDFLGDFHTLGKIKSYGKRMQPGFNEDTLGGILKCGFAQYLALEITRGNNRENRAVARYLPWLYSAPSALQQGTREYMDCVGHVRSLSWLLLGSLTHTAMFTGNGNSHIHGPPLPVAQPIPQEVSCHVADHVQVIISGFPEQSKTSPLHTSTLCHAFILCQLWTVYLEEISKNSPSNSESHYVTMNVLLEFWGKVTPSILKLVSSSEMHAQMVNLHFLSLLEALLECRSILLSKLLPLWSPILFSHRVKLPGHMQARLQNCRNFPPTKMTERFVSKKRESNTVLLRWLTRLQFQMGQIELEPSTATTQFYSI